MVYLSFIGYVLLLQICGHVKFLPISHVIIYENIVFYIVEVSELETKN